MKTLHAAVAKSRGLASPKQIIVNAGTYFLPATLDLTAADSHLTISAAPGAERLVWLSGAQPIQVRGACLAELRPAYTGTKPISISIRIRIRISIINNHNNIMMIMIIFGNYL